jgi:predicted TIM-barrel fold metal-dependent hydrolase
MGQVIFDAHFHVIDPRFPLVANQAFLPEPFTCDDYRQATAGMGIAGGAVVSGSFQAFDQSYLLDALATLGPAFVGVTQLPPDTTDDAIVALDAAGVRAARINLRRGGPVSLDYLRRLAARVHDLAGWHVELYADSGDLADLAPALIRLPRVVIDHLGLSRSGFHHILDLVEGGAMIKATGFGRVDLDVPEALRRVAAVNPGALMFGTDLPSTRAPPPFSPDDVDLLAGALADDDLVHAALRGNALALYRPRASAQAGTPRTPGQAGTPRTPGQSG